MAFSSNDCSLLYYCSFLTEIQPWAPIFSQSLGETTRTLVRILSESIAILGRVLNPILLTVTKLLLLCSLITFLKQLLMKLTHLVLVWTVNMPGNSQLGKYLCIWQVDETVDSSPETKYRLV